VNKFSIAVIKLSGELEIGRKDEIRAALKMPAGATAVLMDFGEITYADSTALAELLRFRAEAESAGVRVAIVTGVANQQFARLITYAGLQEAFAVFEARAAALNYLGGATT
jgi:anti-anti-sigma factor